VTTAAAHTQHDAPVPAQLEQLLDRHAPFRAIPLVPEISVFYGRSLIEVWEAAELLAGGPLPAPFWAYPWAAGSGLARVILDHPEWFVGQRVLDFGCGGGVAALAAARSGADTVVANDLDAWALATVRLAAARQGLPVDTLHTDLTVPDAVWPPCDIVLCSDLAYEKQLAPRQRSVMERARKNGARVFVADAGRKYFRAEGMTLIAEYAIEVPRDLEGVEVRTARVYEMTP